MIRLSYLGASGSAIDDLNALEDGGNRRPSRVI
jgi:hypothetical protein